MSYQWILKRKKFPQMFRIISLRNLYMLIFKFIYLFVCLFLLFGCIGSSCCARAFSSFGERGYSSLRCTGFSLRWLLLLRSTGSRRMGFSSCGVRALERRLSSCGAWASLLRGMWDLPGSGLEPMSPALAGWFPTTVPPRKPPAFVSCRLLKWPFWPVWGGESNTI